MYPPVSLSNVPGVSETNVPPISGTNVPGISLWNVPYVAEINVPPADVNQCQLRYGRNFREVALGLVNVTLWLETNYHEVMANRKATMTDIRVIFREPSRGASLREMERYWVSCNHIKRQQPYSMPRSHTTPTTGMRRCTWKAWTSITWAWLLTAVGRWGSSESVLLTYCNSNQ